MHVILGLGSWSTFAHSTGHIHSQITFKILLFKKKTLLTILDNNVKILI